MLERPSKETDPGIDQQVDWHLLRRGYENETLGCLFTLIVAAGLAAAVTLYAPGSWIPTIWWLGIAIIVIARLAAARRFLSSATIEACTTWKHRYALIIAVTGGIWGIGGALMFLIAPVPQSQMTILIVITAISAGGLVFQGAVLPAYLGYLLGAILPMTAVTALNPNGGTLDIALLSLVYCGAMWAVSMRYNQDRRANIRLSHEKQILSEQFANANRKLEADIDARLRAENLLSMERNVLENIARQMSLEKILNEMNLDVEALFPGSLCSVVLLDPDSLCIRHGSAPNLPESFIHGVDGLRIGPEVGSCGTAMYRKEQVIVEDIAHDPLWRDYRDLALSHDLRACWSTPIISRSGRVQGSFAVYRRKPGPPSTEELETVSRMSRLIALVVENIQNSEKIQLSEQRFRDFAGAAADWFWEMNAALEYTYISKEPRRDDEWPQELVMTRTREALTKATSGFSSEPDRNDPERLNADAPFVFEFSAAPTDASQIEILSVAKPLFDQQGKPAGWRGVGRDITRERQLEREIRHQASHDSLTGLANRREFERHIREILVQGDRSRAEYTAFIDLDGFKLINDNAGHHAGDAVLKRVADILKDAIPGERIVARLGGDEFGASFAAEDAETAAALMERVVRALDKSKFEWGNNSFRIGASVGLVRVSPVYKTTAQVLSDADACCYRAKSQGGGRVNLFRPDPDQFTDDARSTGELIRALKDCRTLIHMQKIRALHKPERIPWYEVLLRYSTGGNAVSSPSRLIPAAERYGQMGVVDIWVLEQVLAHWGGLLAQDRLRLSLNLSASSITHQETAHEIAKLVEQAHVRPGALCFEITETSTLDSLGGAAQFMRDLRGLGCNFVIDNFGSGQSNFSYLKALPGDYLAIDGGYVKTMAADPANHAIVDAIHKVGRAHGMRTLAKSVESQQTLDTLIGLGIDFAQGYHIGGAVPASELALPASSGAMKTGGGAA